jgi:hypothetical protein
MHEDRRLCQIVFQDCGKHGVQRSLDAIVEHQTEVARKVPVGEECEFALQQGLVIVGKEPGTTGELQGQQCAVGVAVKLWRRSPVGHCLQVGRAAEIREQQKALLEILRQDFGHMYSRLLKKRRNVDEGPAVFLVGRGVHDDPGRFVRQVDTKITPKAGIGRGGFDADLLVSELRPKHLLDPVA